VGATQLDVTLLLGAVVLLAAIVAVRFATRIGLPGLLVYLAIGLALQSIIHFDDARRAQSLGLAALVVILAEGGLTTRWDDVKGAVVPAVLLSIFGVAISMSVTALVAHLVLGGGWRLAFLLGAIVSSTDAAAVFSMLRRLKLPGRLAGVLEVESGLNDAPAVIAVVLLSSHHPQTNAGLVIALVCYELVAGAAIGFGVAWLGVLALRRLALPASGLYPLSVLALAVAGFATAALAHASGFLAVYVAGLLLGNSRLPHRPATRSFAEGIAWLAQISLFVMLGVLVIPSELPREILPALPRSLFRCYRWQFGASPSRRSVARSGSFYRGRGCGVRYLSCSPPSPSPRACPAAVSCSASSSCLSSCSRWCKGRRCHWSPAGCG